MTTALALAVAPAAAQAAAVNVTFTPEALEDRPLTFTATTDGSPGFVFAKMRPAGVACAPSYNADSGTDLFFRDTSGTQKVQTFEDPGAYLVCAYLQPSSADPPTAVKSVPVTVRANQATLAIQVAPTATLGTAFPLNLVGTTEVGRQLFAKTKPQGAGPCGPSRSADPSTDSFTFGEPATGTFSLTRLAGPFSTPGPYVICAWLQEASDDPVAEAAAAAVVSVKPPIPLPTSLDVTPSSFAALGSGRSVTDDFRAALVTYTLSNTDASVRFAVSARRSGRRVGSSCRKPTRRLRRRKRCVRYVPLKGSFTTAATRGYNSLRFSGRIGGHRLSRGRYRLIASPSNQTGRGPTLRRSFRITRRR